MDTVVFGRHKPERQAGGMTRLSGLLKAALLSLPFIGPAPNPAYATESAATLNAAACETDSRQLVKAPLQIGDDVLENASLNEELLAEFIKPASVSVIMRDPRVENNGSGFICRSDGHIVTNYHVIEPALEYDVPVKVKLADGRELPAEIRLYDKIRDLAILKVDPEEPLPTLGLVSDSTQDVRQGRRVWTMGDPYSLEKSFIPGHISGLAREIPMDAFKRQVMLAIPVFQIFSGLNPGSSGGPWVERDGRVVAVSESIRGQALGFGVPANEIGRMFRLLDQMPDGATKQEVPHYQLGIQSHPVTDVAFEAERLRHLVSLGQNTEDTLWVWTQQADALEDIQENFATGDVPAGMVITEFQFLSRADKAGLKFADVVTAVNGQPLQNLDPESLDRLIYQQDTSRPMTLTVFRDGKTVEVRIMPENQPLQQ